MSEQIWTLDAFISASFKLVKIDDSKPATSPFKSLRSFAIYPEFTNDNKQTGVFNLKIEFSVDPSSDGEYESAQVADLARDMLNYYINLIVFFTGDDVKKVKPTSLVHVYPDGIKSKAIVFASETSNLIPPVPLYQTDLFHKPLDSKIIRALSFYRYALKERDVLVSTSLLLSALDLISTQFKIESKIISKCDNCGYEKEIGVGSKSKIKYVVTKVGGLTDDDFNSIWELRNSIFHGYFVIDAKTMREISSMRSLIRVLVIKAIKSLMGIDVKDLPLEKSPNWFVDPILTLDLGPKPS